MSNRTITLLTFLFLSTLLNPVVLQAQSQSSLSFNPDTNQHYTYHTQYKSFMAGGEYFNLSNRLSFRKIEAGYQATQMLDRFTVVNRGKLKFRLSAPFQKGSAIQQMQKFLQHLRLTKTLTLEGKSLTHWDFSDDTESVSLAPHKKEGILKTLKMFNEQLHPFPIDTTLTIGTEFSRRNPAADYYQMGDSSFISTDYKILQKTDSTTLLGYQKKPEAGQKSTKGSKFPIKGMIVVENKTGTLLHRRELISSSKDMPYQMVLHRDDTQSFSLNNPSLDSFEYFPMEADTLDKKRISSLFSMQELPDSFDSKAKARRYIDSLPPFLFYRKSLYGNSAQLLYKNIDNKKFIRAEVEWLKGFDTNNKMIFHSKFPSNELSFLVPQGTSDGIKKISDGQFIIPDTIAVLRGSIKFNVEIGNRSRELTKKDVGRKINLLNSNLKLLSWNNRKISYVGLGGVSFYDHNGERMLPQKATAIPYFIPQITALLNKEPSELTKEDFFLYANVDGFPHYRYQYTLHFEKPVSHMTVLEAEKVEPITRTFTIEKE